MLNGLAGDRLGLIRPFLAGMAGKQATLILVYLELTLVVEPGCREGGSPRRDEKGQGERGKAQDDKNCY